MIEPTPEQILAANVDTKQPSPEDVVIEQKIAQAVKGQVFKLQLTHTQVQLLSRFAGILGLTWQEFFKREIESKILATEGHIGQPLITGPSIAKKSKIAGPSK